MPDEFQKQIDQLWEEINRLKKDPPFVDHQHNGFDSTFVEYDDLAHKQLYIEHTIYGTGAATAANYGVFWIAPVKCAVTGFKEVHGTAGSDAGAVTLNLEKLTDGVAPGSGDEVLAANLSLKATADTVQDGTLTSTLAYRTLSVGDRLCLKDGGTLTAVANVTVIVKLTVL